MTGIENEFEYDERNDLTPEEIEKGNNFKLKEFKKSKRSPWLF